MVQKTKQRSRPERVKRYDPASEPLLNYPYPSPPVVATPFPLSLFVPPSHPLKLTKLLFLRGVATTYAMAFFSIWPQIEGLYSNHGILPAHPFLKKNIRTLSRSFPKPMEKPLEFAIRVLSVNLLEIIPSLFGLSVADSMELLCLFGGTVAILTALNNGLCIKVNFLILWMIHKSLFGVGQTFLWFQWDTLLLEVGFLCIIVSPLWSTTRKPYDGINMFLVRWLLFRMMFASGVVKLTGKDKAWWGLTAMPVHYESQCIPTPVAWFAYSYLPTYVHKLSVLGTYVIEILLPFLFLVPTSFLAKITFTGQVKLMLMIMLTGNYNFFNFLYILLCLSLADDSWWLRVPNYLYLKLDQTTIFMTLGRLVRWILHAVTVILLIGSTAFFGFKNLTALRSFQPALNFDHKQFMLFVHHGAEVGIYLGLANLAWQVLVSLYISVTDITTYGFFNGLRKIIQTGFYAFIAACMFGISLSTFTRGIGLNENFLDLPKDITKLQTASNDLQLIHSYGLFRSMTGVGGRPEVVIEGTTGSRENGPWQEIEFRWKPGKLDGAPKFVLPHQPRLDWQMWFAALGTYQHNPWFPSLVYRLLDNEPSVIGLLDNATYPFHSIKPAFIRARRYKYHFTQPKSKEANSGQWWTREYTDEFFPPVEKEDLLNIMTSLNYVDSEGRDFIDKTTNKTVGGLLEYLRNLLNGFGVEVVVWTVTLITLGPLLLLIVTMRYQERNSFYY